jgi:hypothetical protein
LYARECCANTWYAIGAIHARQHRRQDATAAFQQALARVPKHPLARLGLGILERGVPTPAVTGVSAPSFDAALTQAALLVVAGEVQDAMRLVEHALTAAPPGNAGWLIPVEPMLHVVGAQDLWAPVLARLRTRAA